MERVVVVVVVVRYHFAFFYRWKSRDALGEDGVFWDGLWVYDTFNDPTPPQRAIAPFFRVRLRICL